MSDLTRMMRDAAAEPTEYPDVDGAWRRARLHRTGFVALSLVAVMAVTGSAVIAASSIGESDTRPALPGEIEPGGGGAIAFTRFSIDGGIFVMNPDGSEPRRIVDGDRYALDFPAWSPDGSRIAFHGFFGQAANEGGGLFVVNADGSGLKLLELGGGQPTWSPDGTEIAFNTGGSLRVIGADGGSSRTLIDHKQGSPNAEFPDWSPDGSQILFSSGGIGIVDSDGSNIQRLPEHVIDDRPVHPTWSPDGSQIAFTAYTGDGLTGSIDVVNVDGTERHTVGQGVAPTWSPDGTRIAFEAIDGDASHIYSIAIDGSDLQQLTFGPDSDHSPDWIATPDEDASPEPPDCPAVGEGGYELTLEPGNASPGTRVSATGPIPMYGEDGSYSPPSADEAVHFWLDADEKRWEDLIEPGLRPDKDPGEGARYLGSQSLADPTLCTFEFAFDMPDVTPGQHSVVPVMFGGGGAAPYDAAVLLIEDRNADESPCDDDRSYGQTIPGRWLEDLILEIGAPGGYEVTKEEVKDTGTALRIGIPEYDNDPTIYATMLTPGDDPNITSSPPQEEVGEQGSYTLYLQKGNPWQSYKAISADWQLSLIAYPGADNDEVKWPSGALEWLTQAAEMAEESPPQCSGPLN